MLLIEFLVPPTGKPSCVISAVRGAMLAGSVSRNSTLLRLVKRRYPPVYLSARLANWRIVWILSRRGEPTRTVYSLSPDSATWHRTPGATDSWYFHFP